jgi:hypothetical protein
MSEKLNSAIAVIGIDVGKNSFHVVGHDRRGAIVLRSEVVARTGGNTGRQSAAVPYRHGGLRRRASSQPQAATARPRCSADAGEVRAPAFEGAERPRRRAAKQRDELAPPQ